MNLKKVITAINNPILNDKLLNCKNIKVLKNDIQYKEGILEILELEKNIDILILSENLPGEISLIELLLKIKKSSELNFRAQKKKGMILKWQKQK